MFFKKIMLIALAAMLSACASIDPQPALDRIDMEVRDRSGYWAADAAGELLSRPVGLDDAVRIAMANSPALKAQYQSVGIAQANLAQAGLWQNPVFELVRLDGDSESLLEAGVSIQFLDLFMIPLRKRLAAAELEQAELKVTQAVLEQISGVREAWITAVGAHQQLATQRRAGKVLDALVGLSEELRAAGNITELEHTRATLRRSAHALNFGQYEIDAANSRDQLESLLAIPSGLDWQFETEFPAAHEPATDATKFENDVVASSLELAASRLDLEVLAHRAGIHDRERLLPDLEAGWLGERENGEWLTGPGLEFVLPVFDTGKVRNAALAAAIEQIRQSTLAEEIYLRSAARQSLRSLQGRYAAVQHLAHSVIPQLQLEWRAARSHYNAGQTGIADLLDLKLDMIETEQTLISQTAQYWSAWNQAETLSSGASGSTAAAAASAFVLDERKGGH